MKSELSNDEVADEIISIIEEAESRTPPGKEIEVESRSLPEAVEKTGLSGKVPIISEVKPTSPTTEGVRKQDPAELAGKMEAAGAAAISVLTEKHFGGSPENLRKVREAVDVPVLRKDFILKEEELDRVEADIVLLIVRFLDNLEHMIEAARSRGFQVLVEVHTGEEMKEALEAGAEILGVNNRDLTELDVDLDTFEEVAKEAPHDVTLVAESGIKTVGDAERMLNAGADAMLIGTAIMDGEVEENVEKFAYAGES